MRKIKFRAWNSEKKTMRIHDVVVCNGKQVIPVQTSGNDYWDATWEECENILMQFTGLKDKNGVEIYEGDIVKANINNVVSIGKVVYIDDWAMFQTEFTIGNIGRYNCYEADEVIGNIYENPELLDKD